MRAAGLLFCATLAACAAEQGTPRFQGYLEGEYVQVAPEVSGRIVTIAVAEGDTVLPGAALFRLDDAEAAAAVAQARAEVARQEAELANLTRGQRPPEIAVIEAQIAEAEASLQKARKDLQRQEQLFQRQVVAEAALDSAREAVSVAEARVKAQRMQREVAEMPARAAEIAAAEGAVEAARSALKEAETRRAKHDVRAPAEASVDDVHYEPGEVAQPGTAVLSLLPPDGRKVVFFVPEPQRGAVAVGAGVAVSCNGCPADLQATVTRVASEAEYTPPVIFSRETRGKLVFRAEARLAGGIGPVPLGQPVDVTPLAGAPAGEPMVAAPPHGSAS